MSYNNIIIFVNLCAKINDSYFKTNRVLYYLKLCVAELVQ